MNSRPIIGTMLAGFLALTAVLSGCASNTQSENQVALPAGCASTAGFSTETGMACSGDNEVVTTVTTTHDPDKLMPVPDGSLGYEISRVLNTGESTDWYTPVEYTSLQANSAGKPFWVCRESEPNSGIAGYCDHRFEFSVNAFEGYHWNWVANGDQRIQFRADWPDTVIYTTNVAMPPQQYSGGMG